MCVWGDGVEYLTPSSSDADLGNMTCLRQMRGNRKSTNTSIHLKHNLVLLT